MDFNPGKPQRDNASQQPPPPPQIMLIQQHHHHHHHLLATPPPPPPPALTTRRSNRRAPRPLFAGTKRKKSGQFTNDFSSLTSLQSNKPIGAAYTYNWVMWKTFGCGTCLRCAAGWFCLFFAICGILFILWLFGILRICVFFSGYCEIRS